MFTDVYVRAVELGYRWGRVRKVRRGRLRAMGYYHDAYLRDCM